MYYTASVLQYSVEQYKFITETQFDLSWEIVVETNWKVSNIYNNNRTLRKNCQN